MAFRFGRTLLRQIRKNPLTSGIQYFGLTVGLTCFLLLWLLYDYNASYNLHLENGERIVRISTLHRYGDGESYNRGASAKLPETMREEVAGIETATLLGTYYGMDIFNGKEAIEADWVASVDSFHSQVFAHTFIAGNPAEVLSPGKAWISESFARKLFGLGDDATVGSVLGREIRVSNDFDAVITAVLQDPPANSDFGQDLYVSFTDVRKSIQWDVYDWGSTSGNLETYALLAPGNTPEGIVPQLDAIVKKYVRTDQAYNRSYVPHYISAIHSHPHFGSASGNSTPQFLLVAVLAIAVLFVALSVINFVNISIAQSTQRAKEVGIRKVLGSSPRQLVLQLLAETSFVVVASVGLAVPLSNTVLPYLNDLLEIELAITALFTARSWWLLPSIALMTCLTAGLYPALLAARFRPIRVLKGKALNLQVGGINLRKGLLVTQFAIAQLFLVGALVLYSQTNYMQNQPLGFSHDSIVLLDVHEANQARIDRLRAQVLQIPGVERVSFYSIEPSSSNNWSSDAVLQGFESEGDKNVNFNLLDDQYLRLFDLQVAAGRAPTLQDTLDQAWVNESFLRQYQIRNPTDVLGKTLYIQNDTFQIQGVIKDYHTASLHEPISPFAYFHAPGSKFISNAGIKVSGNASQVLPQLKAIWTAEYPLYSYKYTFYDDRLAEEYKTEVQLATLIGAFTGVALLLAFVGLFGLVYILLLRRLKELSVRKVLGATYTSLLRTVSREFVLLVAIASVLVWPLAYYALDGWLSDFAYRIDQSPLLYGGALLAVGLLAVLTIAGLVARVARTNPAEILRDE